MADRAPKETDASSIGKRHSVLIEEMMKADMHLAGKAVCSARSSQLAHELPNPLWKLKQRRSVKEEQALVQQFVSEHVHQSGSEWAFVWKFVLKMIAEDSSGRSTPCVATTGNYSVATERRRGFLRVYSSVVALVQRCVDELEKAGGVICKADECRSIYSQIFPLLLLRRIPSGYYKVTWKAPGNGREGFELFAF